MNFLRSNVDGAVLSHNEFDVYDLYLSLLLGTRWSHNQEFTLNSFKWFTAGAHEFFLYVRLFTVWAFLFMFKIHFKKVFNLIFISIRACGSLFWLQANSCAPMLCVKKRPKWIFYRFVNFQWDDIFVVLNALQVQAILIQYHFACAGAVHNASSNFTLEISARLS